MKISNLIQILQTQLDQDGDCEIYIRKKKKHVPAFTVTEALIREENNKDFWYPWDCPPKEYNKKVVFIWENV
jgi:hypothetical protein